LKKYHVTLLVLLALAAAITVGCGVTAPKATLPTFAKVPFVSSRASSSVFLMNLDGSSLAGIATGNSNETYSPSISADLTVVAYTAGSDVWVTDSTGKTPAQLTSNVTNNYYSFYVKVSPDGKHLLYNLYNGSNYHMLIMNPDGTGSVDLTSPPPAGMTDCYSGSFSADGSKIAFTCEGADSGALYLMNADGSGTTLVYTQSGFLDSAMFTADSTQLLFVAYNSGISAAAARHNLKAFPHRAFRPSTADTVSSNYAIVSTNLDGSALTTLVPNAYEGAILNSNLYYTLYSTDLSLDQIYKSNVDGSSAVSISDGTASDYLGVSSD
jgi:Tol biopolymer transport system component